MLITNSTTGISQYMGNKSRYAIKQSSSFRMASSVLRRQALLDVCKDNARQTETVHSEWKKFHSWKGIMVRHRNRNVSHWLTSSLTCKDLQKNSVSVIQLIELATAESNTHMCYSTVPQSSQIDSRTPALASHQAAPLLTDAFKRMLLLWNVRLKCKINVENNNRTMWFLPRFADTIMKTED